MKVKDFKQFLANNKNVIIEGPHGVGKTEIVKQVFNEAGLNWRYFSAPTMDVWVDFIGVPRASEPDAEGKQFLELVRPREFAEDTVEALFFDEFNRASDKVTNAVMELLQFKSINGRKFENLKVIWVAINPDTEDKTYAVQALDPAIRDRFHVHIQVKEDFIDNKYFKNKYGAVAETFIKWWREYDLCKMVSPRRLDYAIQAYVDGINLDHVLPMKSNVKILKRMLDPKTQVEEEVPVVFNVKPNGVYTEEEMMYALKNNIRIGLALKMSNDFLTKELISKHPRALNYFHIETLKTQFELPNEGKKCLKAYITNYDPEIASKDEFNADEIARMKTLLKEKNLEDDADVLSSVFYGKFLK